jgi:hypothetical protein
MSDRGVACAQHVASLNNLPLAAGSPSAPAGGGWDGNPAIEVDALDTHPPNAFASNLLGLHPSTHATAVATLVGPGLGEDFIPIAVNQTAASGWSSGAALDLTFDQGYTDNGDFFTLLKNNLGCNGVSGLKQCIEHGCGCTVSVGYQIRKDNGNNWGNVWTDWRDKIVGTNVYVPVYDNSRPPATIVGFAYARAEAGTTDNDIHLTFITKLLGPGSGPPGKFFGSGNAVLSQ